MTQCQTCSSTRILAVSAHASDMFCWSVAGSEGGPDYLPRDFGIGGGDDLEVKFCLNCGQVQGTFPMPSTEFEDQLIESSTLE